ncbi:MAG: hypothetical protein ABDH32_01165 [Candidatus Caldarchaeales archaeon]
MDDVFENKVVASVKAGLKIDLRCEKITFKELLEVLDRWDRVKDVDVVDTYLIVRL